MGSLRALNEQWWAASNQAERRRGAMARKLKVGEAAPDFRLATDDGNSASLADFRGRWLLLYFFPKAFTPG